MNKLNKLKDLSLNLREEDYRAMDFMSYSLLSSISKYGVRAIGAKFEKTESMIFGSVVEDLLLSPDDFEYKYFVSHEQVTGVLAEALNIILSNTPKEKFLEKDAFNVVLDYITNVGLPIYYPERTPESRAKKIVAEAEKYIYEYFQAKDKVILNENTIKLASKCAETLRNYEFTSKYFNFIEDDIEVVNQFQGVSTIQGEEYKFMIDRLMVNHKEKTIQVIDIKTGSKFVIDFTNSFYYWRYDIQAILYQAGIRDVLSDFIKEGYTLLPFKFFYIDRNQPNACLIYEISDAYLEVLRKDYNKDNKNYKGVNTLVKEYQWYKKNNLEVDFEEEVYKNNGVVQIT